MHRRRPVIACPPVIHYEEGGEEEAFVKHRLLGYGGFAAVYEVERVSDGCRLAAKVLPLSSLADPNKLRRVQNEIDINQLLHHPHLVTFLGSFQDDANVYLLQELCCVTLGDLLKRVGRMTELQAAHVLWQVLSAVEYLHGCGVAHRDLKLSNAFLALDGTVKLGDLGLACHLPHPAARRRSTCGSLNWMAPEVLRPGPAGYGLEVDLWALGVMLFTLLVGRPPWRGAGSGGGGGYKAVAAANGSTDGGDGTASAAAGGGGGSGATGGESTYDRILSGRYVPPGPGEGQLGPAARDLIGVLLLVDPAGRPSLATVRRHSFFAAHGLTPAAALPLLAPVPEIPLLAATSASPGSSQPLQQVQAQNHGGSLLASPSPWPPPLVLSPFEDLSPSPSLPQPAVDLRQLLGEAGIAALTALAAGVGGRRGAGGGGRRGDADASGDSTSGSYMDLSQSEQCSALTSGTTLTALGGADAGCFSGDAQSQEASSGLQGAQGQMVHGVFGARPRPHSHTLSSMPPQSAVEQALRSYAPPHGNGRGTGRHAHAQTHVHAYHGRAQPHCELRAIQQQAASQGRQQQGQESQRGRSAALHQQRLLARDSVLCTAPVVLPTYSAPAAGAAPATTPGGSDEPAQQAPSHVTSHTTQQRRQHGGVGPIPTQLGVPEHAQSQHQAQPAASAREGRRAVPGAGADQYISLSKASNMLRDDANAGEASLVAAGLGPEAAAAAAAITRLCNAVTDLGAAPAEADPSAQGRCSPSGGAVGLGKGTQASDANERKLHRSCTSGLQATVRRSRLSRAASGGGMRPTGRSHDGMQSLATEVAVPAAVTGQQARAPSPLRPSQEQPAPDRVWSHRQTTDNSSLGASCITSGAGGGATSGPERAGAPGHAALRAAFLSHRPAAASRRLQISRSGRSRRSMGMHPSMLVRTVAATGGDQDGCDDGSSDTARSYADSLEAMLLGGEGRSVVQRTSRHGPAPAGPRGRAVAAALATAPAPAPHPGSTAAPVAIVLRHGRGSGAGLTRSRGGSASATTTLSHLSHMSPALPYTPSTLSPLGLPPGLMGSLNRADAHSAPCVRPLGVTGSSAGGSLPPAQGSQGPCGPNVTFVCAAPSPSQPAAINSPSCDSGPLSLAVFAAPAAASAASAVTPSGALLTVRPRTLCEPETLAADYGYHGRAGSPTAALAHADAEDAETGSRPPSFRRGVPPARCSSDVAPGAGRQPHRPSRDQQLPQPPASAAPAAATPVAVPAPAQTWGSEGKLVCVRPSQMGQGRRSLDRERPGSRSNSGPVARSAPSQLFRACLACCSTPQGGDADEVAPSSDSDSGEVQVHGRPAEPPPAAPPPAPAPAPRQEHAAAQEPDGNACTPQQLCACSESDGHAEDHKRGAPPSALQPPSPTPQQQLSPKLNAPAPVDDGEAFSFQLHPWRAMSLAQLRRSRAMVLMLQREEAAAEEAEWGSRSDNGVEVGTELQRPCTEAGAGVAPLERASAYAASSSWGTASRGATTEPGGVLSRKLQDPSTASQPHVPQLSFSARAVHVEGAKPPKAQFHSEGAASQPPAVANSAVEPPWRASAIRGASGACVWSNADAGTMVPANATAATEDMPASPFRANVAYSAIAAAGRSSGPASAPAARATDPQQTCADPCRPPGSTFRVAAVRDGGGDAYGGAETNNANAGASTGAFSTNGIASSAARIQERPPQLLDPASAPLGPTSQARLVSGDLLPNAGGIASSPPRVQTVLDVEQVLRQLESLDTVDLPPLHFTSAGGSNGGSRSGLAAGGYGAPHGVGGSPGPGVGLTPALTSSEREKREEARTSGLPADGTLSAVVNEATSATPVSLEKPASCRDVAAPAGEARSQAASPAKRDCATGVVALDAAPEWQLSSDSLGLSPRGHGPAQGKAALSAQDAASEAPSLESLPQRRQAPPAPLPRRRQQQPAQAQETHASAAAAPALDSNAMQDAEALRNTDDPDPTALDDDSDLSLGEIIGELHTLDCSVQAAAEAAEIEHAEASAAIPVADAGIKASSLPLRPAPKHASFSMLPAVAHNGPPPTASRLPQLDFSSNGAGGVSGQWLDSQIRAGVPGRGIVSPVAEPVPELDPDALAELASRLRSRSFRAGSFTYRPSRMMPATHRSPRSRAASLATAPAASSNVQDWQGTAAPAVARAGAAAQAAAAPVAAAAGCAAPALSPPVPLPRDVLAVKWLDYSSKYGLSYALSNGAVGVLFRDGTQLVHERGAGHAWLLGPLPAAGPGRTSTLLQPQPLPRSARPVPFEDAAAGGLEGRRAHGRPHGMGHDVEKKLRLLRSFMEVLLGSAGAANGGGGGCGQPRVPREHAAAAQVHVRPEPPAVFLSWWCRTDKALVLVMSSGTLQALFADGSELVLREVDDEVEFLANDGTRHCSSVRAVRMAGGKNSIARRLQYATALLHSRGRHGA